MQLTFRDNKFVLLKHNHLKQVDRRQWQLNNFDEFETTNLKAALDFRPCSDRIAEKVFRRALPVYYRVPQLPPLSFLDPHQRVGVTWILTRSRSYLAHAPGAGKTCQAIVASLLCLKPGQSLFIVPPTLTLNWQRETVRFSEMMGITSTASIVPLSSKKEDIDWTADFIICPDSMITKDWVYTRLLRLRAKFVAVDEASRFKEPFSQRSKAFYGGKVYEKSYEGLFQDARHCVLLDGSPMPNRPMELWAPAFALCPSSIGYLNYYDYGSLYCGPTVNRYTGEPEFKGSSNETQLKASLQSEFMQVVTEDKLKHPERLRSILYMQIPKSKDIEWHKTLPANFSETQSTGALAKRRQEIGLQKINWVANYVRQRLKDKPESILLFAWHREVCEGLAYHLKEYKPAVVYGGTKSEEREEAFRNFQSGQTRIIIGNIQTMGRGHNLQKAGRVVFAEYSWTDELNKQCEKRSSRRGNKEAFVRCEYICASNTLDETVLKSVLTKERRVRNIVG